MKYDLSSLQELYPQELQTVSPLRDKTRMSPWLIGFVSVAYAGTGIEQMLKGNIAFGIMWICYAVANVCLMKAGGV